MGQLRVGYPYYKDFSKWLQRQSLKHMAGGTEASRAILDRMRYTKLSKRDVDICLGFDNKNITGAVLSNRLIKNTFIYKLLIQKGLYKDLYFLRQALNSFDRTKVLDNKIKIGIVKRLNKDYENKEQLNWEDLLNRIYEEEDTLPAFPVISHTIVKAYVSNERSYSWRHNIDWSGKIVDMTSSTIKEYIKEILKEDILRKRYKSTSHFFERMLKEDEDKGRLCSTFQQLIPYIKSEIVPNVHYAAEDPYATQLTNLMTNLFKVHRRELISSEYLMDLIQSMHTDDDNVVSNLIKFIQVQSPVVKKEVENKIDNFKDKIKSIIESA